MTRRPRPLAMLLVGAGLSGVAHTGCCIQATGASASFDEVNALAGGWADERPNGPFTRVILNLHVDRTAATCELVTPDGVVQTLAGDWFTSFRHPIWILAFFDGPEPGDQPTIISVEERSTDNRQVLVGALQLPDPSQPVTWVVLERRPSAQPGQP